jgi:hypothetical protein
VGKVCHTPKPLMFWCCEWYHQWIEHTWAHNEPHVHHSSGAVHLRWALKSVASISTRSWPIRLTTGCLTISPCEKIREIGGRTHWKGSTGYRAGVRHPASTSVCTYDMKQSHNTMFATGFLPWGFMVLVM